METFLYAIGFDLQGADQRDFEGAAILGGSNGTVRRVQEIVEKGNVLGLFGAEQYWYGIASDQKPLESTEVACNNYIRFSVNSEPVPSLLPSRHLGILLS